MLKVKIAASVKLVESHTYTTMYDKIMEYGSIRDQLLLLEMKHKLGVAYPHKKIDIIMKILQFTLLLTVVLTTIISCKNDSSQLYYEHKKSEALLHPENQSNENRPPELVPRDNWIFDALFNESISWEDVDAFYKNNLSKFEHKKYYNNLKTLNIMTLVKVKKDFLKEAPLEILIYYAEEDRKMHREGGLETMAILYNEIATRGKQKVAAQLAHDKINVLLKEYDIVSISQEEYFKKHEDAITQLKLLMYDRWGNPLFD